MSEQQAISEARLQSECYWWFAENYPTERPYLWANLNNPRSMVTGSQLKGMGMLAGIADMTYLAFGNYPYFLELKLPNGRQSKQQIEFAQNIERRGGIYAVVRSIEEFKFWVHVGMTHAGHYSKALPYLILYAENMQIDYKPLMNLHEYLWQKEGILSPDTIDYFTNLKLTIQ